MRKMGPTAFYLRLLSGAKVDISCQNRPPWRVVVVPKMHGVEAHFLDILHQKNRLIHNRYFNIHIFYIIPLCLLLYLEHPVHSRGGHRHDNVLLGPHWNIKSKPRWCTLVSCSWLFQLLRRVHRFSQDPGLDFRTQIDKVFTIFDFCSVCSIKTNTWLHVQHIYPYYADNPDNAVLAAAYGFPMGWRLMG